MSVRTDLAVESLTAAAAIEPKQRGTYFQITEVTISNAEQAAAETADYCGAGLPFPRLNNALLVFQPQQPAPHWKSSPL